MPIEYRLLYTNTQLHATRQQVLPAVGHLVVLTRPDGAPQRYHVAAVQWVLDHRQGPDAEGLVQVFLRTLRDDEEV